MGTLTRAAAVAIGRNEGERLRACLESLQAEVARVVYVDSGSRDGSADLARSLGVTVVELDPAQPFSAARARNEGFEALRADGQPEFVQFIDGDCTLVSGWIEDGVRALDADPALALVTGWRSEERPEANAYHAMAEIEWRAPSGAIETCGGDMLLRASVFDELGGFDPRIVASEDEEFTRRLRKAGHGALRLPFEMTRHDIAMTRFREWWRRHLRSGQGFAEVGGMHPPHFAPERRRALLWGGLLPILFLAALVWGAWWLALLVLAAWAASFLRLLSWLKGRGLASAMAVRVAFLFLVAKLPQCLGMARFYIRGGRGAEPRIIEYDRGAGDGR